MRLGWHAMARDPRIVDKPTPTMYPHRIIGSRRVQMDTVGRCACHRVPVIPKRCQRHQKTVAGQQGTARLSEEQFGTEQPAKPYQLANQRKEGIETSSKNGEASGFVKPAQDERERERERDRSCLALDERSQNYEKGTSRPDGAGHVDIFRRPAEGQDLLRTPWPCRACHATRRRLGDARCRVLWRQNNR